MYRQAVEIKPDWAEGWFYLGTIAYDRGQFQAAVEALDRVVKLAPGDVKSWAMLGLSEAQVGQNKPALSHLNEALRLGVGDDANMRPVVLFTRANLLLADGAYGQAQQILDQLARERKTANEELLIALGRSVLGVTSASAADVKETRDLLLAAGKAEMLAANRENAPALAAYRDLVAQYPKTHNVEFAYGRFLLDAHLDEQAVAAFKSEIVNSPQHLLARLGIAGVLLRTDPASSRIYAEQAVHLAPRSEEAHYLFGAALYETGSAEKSIAELETAERMNANDPRVWFVLAKAYKQTHRENEAAQARKRFTELSAAH